MTNFKCEAYDKEFLRKNMMGPNSLRLAEELLGNVRLEKGMRVLDLGCGTGLTSIFLAQEFGATVFAVDLWIEAEDNYARIAEFGLQDRIIPLHVDAHQLPFAKRYFDAVISIDAYHYFGAKTGYLEQYLAPLVKKDGVIAVAIPGLKQPFTNGVPQEMRPFWEGDMNFYTGDYWRDLWTKSGAVSVEVCKDMACYDLAWADWLECDNPYAIRDIDMMRAEGGNYFNFTQIVGWVK